MVYFHQMDSIKKEAFNKLTAIRDLKVEQVNDWFDERLGYITTVSKDFEIRSLDNHF